MRIFGFVLIYFFAELGLFVLFAQHFGFWTLVAEILLSGIMGVFLLTSIVSGDVRGVFETLRNVRSPQEIFFSRSLRVLGAFLLILPGLLSDSVGLLLSLGIFDALVIAFMQKIFPKPKNKEQDFEIIDVEVIEENERIER